MKASDRAVAERALRGKVGACPGCRGRKWRVVEMVAVFPYRDQGVTLGAPAVPLVLVGCVRCALVRQFSAVQLGLVEPLGDEEPTT